MISGTSQELLTAAAPLFSQYVVEKVVDIV